MHCKNRKMRHKNSKILLEGKRLILDVIDSGHEIQTIFFSHQSALEDIPHDVLSACTLYKVPLSELKLWSDVVTSTGVLAVCHLPSPNLDNRENTLPLSLLCDNIRDPGNMGTLLRSALAVGCRTVYATKGCCDVWDPKVLRSGMGAHFHLHILQDMPWELMGNYISPDTKVLLADSLTNNDRRRTPSAKTMQAIADLEENKEYEINKTTGNTIEIDNSFSHRKTVDLFKAYPFQTDNMYDTDLSKSENLIIIGGETEGLSADAHKFAYDRHGQKIFLPISDKVDSLNAAMAGTLIMFEVKRQLLSAKRAQHRNENDSFTKENISERRTGSPRRRISRS